MRETESHIKGTVEALSFTEGPFQGIIFGYSKVNLIENIKTTELCIKFDYDIYENPFEDFDVQEFETELGEHLTDLLHNGLATNSIIFSGGT